MNGTVNYQDEVEYSSELYALQTSIQGTASGFYTGSLDIVLTHVRIDNATKPNYGEGFSIVSYVSESGSGEGWTYARLTSPGIVEINGSFSEPLNSMVDGILKNRSARSLILNLHRITVGLPPSQDLRVVTSGPARVSPGERFSYEHEISNIGPKTAYDLQVVEKLSPYVSFVSASNGYTYDPITHSVSWDFERLDPFSRIDLSTQVKVLWGLSIGTIIRDTATVEQQKKNIFYHGIGWSSYQNALDAQETAKNLDAVLRASYWDTNALTGAAHVYFAYYHIPTAKNYLINSEGGKQYKIAFSHSGGTQTLIKKLESGDVKADYAVFAAPALIDQQQINNLVSGPNKRVKKVIIVQSDDDILYQLKLEYRCCTAFTLPIPIPPYLIAVYIPTINALETPLNADWDGLIRLIPVPVGYLLSSNNINPDQLPDNEIFWIGGASRNIQTPFFGSPDIIVINEGFPYTNPREVHSGLLSRTVQRFMNGEYPFNGGIDGLVKKESFAPKTSIFDSKVIRAHDPNIKYGHEGFVLPAQKLNYTVEFENEGEGTAFGVYFTDTLDTDLNASTLEIGPVFSTKDDSIIAPLGIFNQETRTISWFVGEVGQKEGGYANYSVNLRSDAVEGTEVINHATVYFPSVPEETITNSIVSIIDTTPPKYSDVSQSESNITLGEIVGAYTYWKDVVRLNYTWLETNESGTWQNVSFLNQSGNVGWSIFTIKPTLAGETCWRIHANDTAGNVNVTPMLCFEVLPPADATPPITNIILSGTNGSIYWYISDVEINLTATDMLYKIFVSKFYEKSKATARKGGHSAVPLKPPFGYSSAGDTPLWGCRPRLALIMKIGGYWGSEMVSCSFQQTK